MKSDKELYLLWKKYVDSKNFYRLMSEEYITNVKKHGLDPKKDPFSKKIKSKIIKFFDIIRRLEKKDIIYEERIGKRNEPITGKGIAKRSEDSMKSNFIDFTPVYLQVLKFKRKWRGGALTTAVYNFCIFLKDNENYLKNSEKILLKEMAEWVDKKRDYKNRIMFFKGSNNIFELAKFHYHLKTRKNQRYWASPFGSFKHFKKVIKKHGYKKYLPYLKGETLFYMRVTSKIPPSEISKIL